MSLSLNGFQRFIKFYKNLKKLKKLIGVSKEKKYLNQNKSEDMKIFSIKKI